jgi:hypothetical protein
MYPLYTSTDSLSLPPLPWWETAGGVSEVLGGGECVGGVIEVLGRGESWGGVSEVLGEGRAHEELAR